MGVSTKEGPALGSLYDGSHYFGSILGAPDFLFVHVVEPHCVVPKWLFNNGLKGVFMPVGTTNLP